jgi:hypothetical protein
MGIAAAPPILRADHWVLGALRRLAEPFELMKFTLIYDGDLPATGNSSRKPGEVARIRNYFHDQLADLWDSHIILRELERTARVPHITVWEEKITKDWGVRDYEPPKFRDPIAPLEPGQVDLCAPIQIGTSVAYRPIIRKSLGLGCALDITFLRQEEPGELVLQGGDIDGRIKTLFDALRMPSKDEEEASRSVPTANPLQCLLESDALISDLSIKTGRLLGARAKKVHAVHLTIDVTVKVLRFSIHNQCLIGE